MYRCQMSTNVKWVQMSNEYKCQTSQMSNEYKCQTSQMSNEYKC